MATLDEQETTITFGRTEPVARIYTSDLRHLRKLRADNRATEVRGGEDWAEFTVPSERVSALRIFRSTRPPMTPEQKRAAADRLRAARSQHSPSE